MNIRVRGRVKVGLLVAFAAAISNLRAADRRRADLAAARALNKLITEATRSRARHSDHALDQILVPPRRRTRRPTLYVASGVVLCDARTAFPARCDPDLAR